MMGLILIFISLGLCFVDEGLLRCGKSCRLRWINYLRSDLKRGNISAAEEEIIIKLHASLGNRYIYIYIYIYTYQAFLPTFSLKMTLTILSMKWNYPQNAYQ